MRFTRTALKSCAHCKVEADQENILEDVPEELAELFPIYKGKRVCNSHIEVLTHKTCHWYEHEHLRTASLTPKKDGTPKKHRSGIPRSRYQTTSILANNDKKEKIIQLAEKAGKNVSPYAKWCSACRLNVLRRINDDRHEEKW